jgi:hypothetical protein
MKIGQNFSAAETVSVDEEEPPDTDILDSEIIQGEKPESGFVRRSGLPDKVNRLSEPRFTP